MVGRGWVRKYIGMGFALCRVGNVSFFWMICYKAMLSLCRIKNAFLCRIKNTFLSNSGTAKNDHEGNEERRDSGLCLGGNRGQEISNNLTYFIAG